MKDYFTQMIEEEIPVLIQHYSMCKSTKNLDVKKALYKDLQRHAETLVDLFRNCAENIDTEKMLKSIG